MGRRASTQTTATKGVLDPDLSARNDLQHYYDSLGRADNTLFHPQGGFSARGGFELVSDAGLLATGGERRLRRAVVPLHVAAANVTAVNGGLASSLVDQNIATVFTTSPVTSAAFVVAEVDFLAPQRVDLVDVIGYRCETGARDLVLYVEYYEGGLWKEFADAYGAPKGKGIRTTPRTRRFGVTPGGIAGQPVMARYWRLILKNATGVGTFSVAGLRFWRETGRLPPQRLYEVSRDANTSCVLVIAERNIDVFEGQRYLASIPLDVSHQQVPQLAFAGGFDTLIVFHEMLETQRIVRQGSNTEWDIGPVPFADVPQLIEGTVFSGDQDEIQDLMLDALLPTDTFKIMMGGAVTWEIGRSTPDLAGAIGTALRALPGVATGETDVIVGPVAGGMRVRFYAANGSRAWPLLQVIGMSDTSPAVETKVMQQGLERTGPMFGATTGWPRAGAFMQQRLMLAGFRAAPTSYQFSQNPNYWSFLGVGNPATADRAFGGALDVDDVEIINEVFVGRHLQLFTEAGEWYSETAVLDATQPLVFKRATSHGIARGVPIVFADGATIFMQKGGRTLRDYIYGDVEQSYSADPLNVLAPHLMKNVVDVASRPARSVTEGNVVFMVNDDGTMPVMTLLRGQKVVACAPWTAAGGAFRAVLATSQHQVLAITERAGDRWLELWVPDSTLDFATRLSGAPRTVVSGAHHLEGRADVWVIADDDLLGPFTVVNGSFVLPEAAENIVYGLAPEWRVRTNVLRQKLQDEQPFRSPGRIYEVGLTLRATGDLLLGANEGPLHPVPLQRAGPSLDWAGPEQTEDGGAAQLPLMQRLFSGDIVRTGLLGFTSHPAIELSRAKPAPVHIKAIRYEVVMRGD